MVSPFEKEECSFSFIRAGIKSSIRSHCLFVHQDKLSVAEKFSPFLNLSGENEVSKPLL